MSKFKVGDRVKVLGCTCNDAYSECDSDAHQSEVGKVGEITEIRGAYYPYHISGVRNEWSDEELELVTSKGVKKVTEPKKHLYRLKKDTLGHKAGVIVKEQCTDGTQDFDVLDSAGDTTGADISRSLVVDNPTWFEEVKLSYEPVKKPGRKVATKSVSTYWTPERKAAQSRRMKRIRKQRAGNWSTR